MKADLIHSTDPREIPKYFLRQGFLTQEDTGLIQSFTGKNSVSMHEFLERFYFS